MKYIIQHYTLHFYKLSIYPEPKILETLEFNSVEELDTWLSTQRWTTNATSQVLISSFNRDGIFVFAHRQDGKDKNPFWYTFDIEYTKE